MEKYKGIINDLKELRTYLTRLRGLLFLRFSTQTALSVEQYDYSLFVLTELQSTLNKLDSIAREYCLNNKNRDDFKDWIESESKVIYQQENDNSFDLDWFDEFIDIDSPIDDEECLKENEN